MKQLPTAADFEAETRLRWADAAKRGRDFVDIRAGTLHGHLGGYPAGPGGNHRMPVCCEVMKRLMTSRDRILSAPRSGQGASLTIRYSLPR
jgi:5-methylcytosine-specific restriction protein A